MKRVPRPSSADDGRRTGSGLPRRKPAQGSPGERSRAAGRGSRLASETVVGSSASIASVGRFRHGALCRPRAGRIRRTGSPAIPFGRCSPKLLHASGDGAVQTAAGHSPRALLRRRARTFGEYYYIFIVAKGSAPGAAGCPRRRRQRRRAGGCGFATPVLTMRASCGVRWRGSMTSTSDGNCLSVSGRCGTSSSRSETCRHTRSTSVFIEEPTPCAHTSVRTPAVSGHTETPTKKVTRRWRSTRDHSCRERV